MIMKETKTPIYCGNKAVCKFCFSLKWNLFNPSCTKVTLFYYLDKQLPTVNCAMIYMNLPTVIKVPLENIYLPLYLNHNK